MSKIATAIAQWRAMGPAKWAEHAYGWLIGGKPIVLAAWQRAVLDAWFAHYEDVSCLAISNVKKTGKTTLNAILTCWRWLCLPSEHYCCGNDFDQSAGRHFKMIVDMCKKHPVLGESQGKVKYRRIELTFLPTGSTVSPIAVDDTGNSGSNFSSSSHTESWGVGSELSIRAWEEMTPPPDLTCGFPALRISDSYAGWSGESETWHNLVDRGLQGERVSEDWPIYLDDAGLMLFHIGGEEAQKRCFRGSEKQRNRYYKQQRASLRKNAYLRLHENARVGSETSFLPTIDLWDACVDPALFVSLDMPTVVDRERNRYAQIWGGERYGDPADLYPSAVLAMDASTGGLVTGRAGDSFALVVLSHLGDDATRFAVRYAREIRPAENGLIDWQEVQDEFDAILARFSILCCVFDPFALAQFAQLNRHKVFFSAFSQAGDRVRADTALYHAIAQKRVWHYGDPALRKHILNCAGKAQGTDGNALRLVKKSPFARIDMTVALSMALATAQKLNF